MHTRYRDHDQHPPADLCVLAACEPTRNTTYLLNYNMIYDSRVTVHVERIGCEAKNYAPATSVCDSRVTATAFEKRVLDERLLN